MDLKPIERDILRALVDAGDLLIQDAITLAVHAGDGTVKDALKMLERHGYVHRPRGQRSGYTVTEKGKVTVKD